LGGKYPFYKITLKLHFKLEHQRQQLLQERQQFHLEQLRVAESRQRQMAAQQLLNEGKLTMPIVASTVQASSQSQPQQQQQQQPISVMTNGSSNTALIPSNSVTSSMPSPANNATSQNVTATTTVLATENSSIQRPPSRPSSQPSSSSIPISQDMPSKDFPLKKTSNLNNRN
jgi:hypothetical protein